ncbi:uncharacterized protein LOC110713587 [Chenopodium quinoa]|uniref:uncharacterized protein LOC110713587 n=1 Tax=Chenopodium quinoa TaxID=63459 RepID=UPI000B78914E|nr:uncharacterized protein LOC110713587 [Chenopodium quinoa]
MGDILLQAMPFGLKNAGATYQRAATTILHDLIHDTVEVYVDDMIVKSHDRFIVSQEGIKVDSDKVKAIKEFLPPKNEKEIRVLMPPKPGEPLLLYLTVTETAMGGLLAQYQEGTKKEIAIYYLSKKFLEYETRYSPLERACIALIYATKKLRHYLQAHTTLLTSRLDPIKYIFEKPILSKRFARWHATLSEFDIQCVSQKSVKGRAISEALADGPISGDEFDNDFPDEHLFNINTSQWNMYFDGASNKRGNGAGVLLIDPFSIKLSFPTTNNTAEYEACIYGVKAALVAGARNLIVYGDSNLIISQTIGVWRVRDERLQMYTDHLQQLIPCFEEIDFKHLPREQNSFTDALANLAVNLTWEDNVKVRYVTIEEKSSPVIMDEEMIASLTIRDEKDTWYSDIKNFLATREYPEGSHKKDQLAIRWLATHFVILKDQLYHKGFDGALQLCIHGEQVRKVMEEIHGGECGPHMNRRMLARKILRAGYYWTILETDCIHFVAIHLKASNEHQSSHYRPQTNGAVEAANKTIRKIIAKMTEKTREWPDKLPYALWGYRISIRTPTGTTPYSLVYGMEPILPIEIEIQSLRVMNESEISEDQWLKLRTDELALANERRLQALHNTQLYQRRIARAFNKKVRDRDIHEGDLVLKENCAPLHDPRGKFKPNWSGPFLVKHITPVRAVKLVNMNGDTFLHFTNLD